MSTPKKVVPQDVLDYLEQEKKTKGFENKEDLDKAVESITSPAPFEEMSDEEKEAFNTELDDTPTKPEVDTPVDPDMDQAGPSDVIDWSMETEDLGTVDVSDEEKDLYMKSLLNDVPFRLDITPINGITIGVKARTVLTDEVIFALVRKDCEEKNVAGVESMWFALQRYLMCAQVTHVNGNDMELKLSDIEGWEAKMEATKNHFNKHYGDIPLTKWNLLSKAVRIFLRKQKICNDRVLDNSFWNGAGTN